MKAFPATFVVELLKSQIDFATRQLQAVSFWSLSTTEFDKINCFVNSTKKVLLCTGAPLSGKSAQLHDIVIKWSNAKLYTIIPIYIDLNKIVDLRDQFIVNYLQITYKLNDDQINDLKNSKEVVLLFDNYNKETLANLFVTQSLADWQGKSIIVCSSNYLDRFLDHTACFIPYNKGKRCSELFEELSLPLLNKEQIKQYFDQKILLYENDINNFPLSLLSHPFFLKLIVAELPRFKEEFKNNNHSFNNHIYQFIVEQWFIAQEKQLQVNGILNKRETIVQACFEYCHLLANQMQQQETLEIIYQPSSHVLSNQTTSIVWDKFFNNNSLKIRSIKYACPFTFERKNRYRFIADDLISYFAGLQIDKVLASLSELHVDTQQMTNHASGGQNNTIKRLDALLKHPLNEVLLTQNANIMHLLADQIRQDKNFKLFLFELLYASRNDKRLETAAANAITALNYAKVSFANLDLSGVNIRGADLQYGNFNNAKFIGADLTDVNFRNAYLVGANFSDAIMQNVFLGEFAFIDLENEIEDICLNTDRSMLAASLENNTIAIVNVRTNEINQFLTGHNAGILAIHFHPTQKILASASSDKTIRIWDIAKSKTIKIIKYNLAVPVDIKFSPNGAYLACAYDDNTIVVRETDNYLCHRILDGHADDISVLDFDSTSSYIVSADASQVLKLWDILTGRCIRNFSHLQNKLTCLCVKFSPDNQFIASSGYGKNIDIWHVPSGECRLILEGHTEQVLDIDFSIDGKSLISASYDKSIRVWSLKTGLCDQVLDGHIHSSQAVRFKQNQQEIISAGRDGKLRFLPIYENKIERQLFSHNKNIESLVFNSNGKFLACGEETIIYVWNIATGVCQFVLKGHKDFRDVVKSTNNTKTWRGAITALKFTPDDQYLISASNDMTIRIWDMKTGLCKYILSGHVEPVKTIAVSADGNKVISGGEDKIVKIWDINTGKELNSLTGHTQVIRSVCFSSDGLYAASGSGSNYGEVIDNRILVWDLSTNQCCAILKGNTAPVWQIGFTHDQKALISMTNNNMLQIWPLEPSLLGTCQVIEDEKCTNKDNHLKEQDLLPEEIKVPSVEHFEEGGHLFIFSPDRKYLAYGDGLSPMRILSLDTFKIIKTIKIDYSHLYSFHFDTNVLHLATVNNREHAIRVWQSQRGIFPDNEWFLFWTTKTLLNASECIINNAQMSVENYHVLKQYGAKGQPKINDKILVSTENNLSTDDDVNKNNSHKIVSVDLMHVDVILQNRIAALEISSEDNNILLKAQYLNDLAQALLNNEAYEQCIANAAQAELLLNSKINADSVDLVIDRINLKSELSEKLQHIYFCKNELSQSIYLMANAFGKLNNYAKSIENYIKSIAIRRELLKSIPEKLSSRNKILNHFRHQLLVDLAKTFLGFGIVLLLSHKIDEAIDNLKEAFEYYEQCWSPPLGFSEGDHPRLHEIKFLLFRFGNELFFRGDHEGAKKCYAAYELDFLNWKTHSELIKQYSERSDYNNCIQHCEIINKICPQVISIYHNMGCYYHVKGIKEKDSVALKKSEECFLRAIGHEANNAISAKVEYALFLINQKRPLEAISYLELSIAVPNIQGQLHYDDMEQDRLPWELDNELLESTEIKINTKIMAYYLLAQAYEITDQNSKISKIMASFISTVDKMKNALAYSLLGYTFCKINNFIMAKKYFEYTLAMKCNSILTKQNIERCQQQIDLQNVQTVGQTFAVELTTDNPAPVVESSKTASVSKANNAALLVETSATLFHQQQQKLEEADSEEELKLLEEAMALSLELIDNLNVKKH